jgi:16S rRNA G966 N2-methylase RsmD
LPLLARRRRRFELIFADPPYELGWSRNLVPLLEEADLLADSGIFVLEHSCREPLEGWNPLIWGEPQTRDYGDTALTFLPRRGAGEEMS